MRTSSTRIKRKLTRLEWAFIVVPVLIAVALLWGERIRYALTGTLFTRQQKIGAINFSSDSKKLVAVAFSGGNITTSSWLWRSQDIISWDVVTGQRLIQVEVKNKEATMYPLVYESGAVIAAVVHSNSPWQLQQWIPKSGTTVIKQKGVYPGRINSLSDNRLLISSGKSIIVYDAQMLKPLFTIPMNNIRGHLLMSRSELTVLDFNKAAKGVVGEVWSLTDGKKIRSFRVKDLEWWEFKPTLPVSPNGQFFADVGPKKAAEIKGRSVLLNFNHVDIALYDTPAGKKLKTFRHIRSVYRRGFEFSSDGTKLLCAGPIFYKEPKNGAIDWSPQNSVGQIIDIKTSKVLTIEIPGNLNRCAFSPNGKLIAASTGRASAKSPILQVYDAKNGRLLFSDNSANEEVSFQFSPDSKTLAYSRGSSIRLMDVTKLK